MRVKKVPKDIVGNDARQWIRKAWVIRRVRGVIHGYVVPVMLTAYELIKHDSSSAVAFRSRPFRHIGQRACEVRAESVRRCGSALIRLWSGPITEHLILRREA